jgi:hypothetical protein
MSIAEHHPHMGPWYTGSRNEYYLIDHLKERFVKLNDQAECLGEDFKIYAKYDDWHKFGVYFTQHPGKDVVYCYNHGDIFKVDVTECSSKAELAVKFQDAK